MALRLTPFTGSGITEARVRSLLARHERETLPRLERLWAYYRNPMHDAPALRAGSTTRHALAQERGLPERLRAGASALRDDRANPAREIVIENDIAWRLHAMVDFMAGRAPAVVSGAPQGERRERVEALLEAVVEASGGAGFVQDLALLGAVYGSVGIVVRFDGLFGAEGAGGSFARAMELVRTGALRLEVVEATRLVPIVSEREAGRLDGLLIRVERERAETGRAVRTRFVDALFGKPPVRTGVTLEILSGSWRQVYVDERLVEEGPNPLGALPATHIQNTSQPLRVEGLSEVEPLIPLQDELNTRLSDRANRVTLQSFKMYLAKGVESLEGGALTVAPGRVITSDNAHASIEAFGGDAASPSEERHVEEVRGAMDKASGVTPLAAGVIETKLGNLSSENALRVTLLGLIAKTARKQASYGRGLAGALAIALRALDMSGVFRTGEAERAVRLRWPEVVPRDERAAVETARMKIEIGVAREKVLEELGYAGAGENEKE